MQRESPPPLLRERRAPTAGYSAGAGGAARQGAVEAPRGSLPVGGRAGRGAGGDARGEAAGQEMGIAAAPEAKAGAEGRRRRPTRRTPSGRKVARDARAGAAGAGRRPSGRTRRRRSTPCRRCAGGWTRTRPRGAGAQPVRQFRMAWIGALFVVVALLALLIGRGLRHGGGDATARGVARPARRRSQRATAPATGPRRAHRRRAGGREPAARAGAAAGGARRDRPRRSRCSTSCAREKPDNADAPYLLAMIYFDNHRWSEGLAAAQMAVRKNPDAQDGSAI